MFLPRSVEAISFKGFRSGMKGTGENQPLQGTLVPRLSQQILIMTSRILLFPRLGLRAEHHLPPELKHYGSSNRNTAFPLDQRLGPSPLPARAVRGYQEPDLPVSCAILREPDTTLTQRCPPQPSSCCTRKALPSGFPDPRLSG